jgi:hypothetical protein
VGRNERIEMQREKCLVIPKMTFSWVTLCVVPIKEKKNGSFYFEKVLPVLGEL